jgi:hypothetical protein
MSRENQWFTGTSADGNAIPQAAQRTRHSDDSTRSHSSFPGSYHRFDTIGPDSHLATTPEINASPFHQPGRESTLDRKNTCGILRKSPRFQEAYRMSPAGTESSGSAKKAMDFFRRVGKDRAKSHAGPTMGSLASSSRDETLQWSRISIVKLLVYDPEISSRLGGPSIGLQDAIISGPSSQSSITNGRSSTTVSSSNMVLPSQGHYLDPRGLIPASLYDEHRDVQPASQV